ncbi:hypothetical protein [Kitasatospora griseola]
MPGNQLMYGIVVTPPEGGAVVSSAPSEPLTANRDPEAAFGGVTGAQPR